MSCDSKRKQKCQTWKGTCKVLKFLTHWIKRAQLEWIFLEYLHTLLRCCRDTRSRSLRVCDNYTRFHHLLDAFKSRYCYLLSFLNVFLAWQVPMEIIASSVWVPCATHKKNKTLKTEWNVKWNVKISIQMSIPFYSLWSARREMDSCGCVWVSLDGCLIGRHSLSRRSINVGCFGRRFVLVFVRVMCVILSVGINSTCGSI